MSLGLRLLPDSNLRCQDKSPMTQARLVLWARRRPSKLAMTQFDVPLREAKVRHLNATQVLVAVGGKVNSFFSVLLLLVC